MTLRHECAARGCNQMVLRGHLMCGAHWLGLPKVLRDDVNRNWRAYQRADTDHKPKARNDYDRAVEAAEAFYAKEGADESQS